RTARLPRYGGPGGRRGARVARGPGAAGRHRRLQRHRRTWPIAGLAHTAHRHGARIAVDAAQLVPHRRLNLTALALDYVAFSGHKLYTPSGAGVLIGRPDWLAQAEPYLRGGGAVRNV